MMSAERIERHGSAGGHGEKTLASNPNSLGTLTLLANAYADDPRTGSLNSPLPMRKRPLRSLKQTPLRLTARTLAAGLLILL